MPSSSPLRRWFCADWSQLFYPGPRRAFTADEMARAGSQPWPVGIDQYLYVNLIVLLAANSPWTRHMPWLWPLALGLAWAALLVARWLWRAPTRRRLNMASYAVGVVIAGGGILSIKSGWQDDAQKVLPLVLGIMVAVLTAWWLLTLFRAEQIEARLRELAEQGAALRLRTRLAAAQIKPHFLFNTLASLQHWVDTGDARAAPLLRDFTAYLRATLPMFEHELQPLGDEVEMVRRYLAIMQARLGARLSVEVDIAADARDALLPPGVVLTLVENAIAHGIEPRLQGGHIQLHAARADGRVTVSLRDDGDGLAPGCVDGVGLNNSRRRLLQACPEATLTLSNASPGCLVLLTLPSP